MINTDNKNLGVGSYLSVMLNFRQFHFSLNKLSKKMKVVSGLVFTVILPNGGRSLPNIYRNYHRNVMYVIL